MSVLGLRFVPLSLLINFASMDSKCTICDSEFTNSIKKPVQCPYCNVSVCMQCAQKCALTWADAPKCPHCKKSFTTDTIDSMFTKSFRKGALRIEAIKNLQEREMSLLPETATKMALEKAELEYRKTKHQMETETIHFMTNPIQNSVLDLARRLKALQDYMISLNYVPVQPGVREPARARVQHRTLKCSSDGCLGYIPLSGPGVGRCASCHIRICGKCHDVCKTEDEFRAHHRTENAICNPETLATIVLIRDSSTNCPKCGTPIQKIEGCNQMWCTIAGCNTAFDYSTGRIINGPIHNPHYHEWLRQNGAALGIRDGPCGGLLVYPYATLRLSHMYSRFAQKNYGHITMYRIFTQWLRALPEMDDRIREQTQRNPVQVYEPNTYEDLRREYLNQKISKKHWAKSLSHKETIRQKNAKLSQIRDTFRHASRDIWNLFYDKVMSEYPEAPTTNGVRGEIPVIPLDKGIPMLVDFHNALESLRMYYIQQLMIFYSEYSDKYMSILFWKETAISGRSFNVISRDETVEKSLRTYELMVGAVPIQEFRKKITKIFVESKELRDDLAYAQTVPII